MNSLTPSSIDESSEVVWPSVMTGWAVVAMLVLAYLLSFIDRIILSLLVAPIKADLDLSDVQIALVAGAAFGVFYSLMGLPLGWLVDRRNRMRIIAVGILIWSVATSACGLASNFSQLFAARVVVGIGEAALAPAAISLIADLFPPQKRALPVATFVMAGSLGGGAAMMIGGQLIAWLSSAENVVLPFIGGVAAWQAVFIVVGLPGVGLAAVFAMLREPARQTMATRTAPGFIMFLKFNLSTLLPLFGAMTLLGLYSYGLLTWLPTAFGRAHGWSASEFGLRFGAVFFVFGGLGAVLGGYIAARARARGDTLANLRFAALGLALLAVPAIIAPMSTDSWSSLALFAPVLLLIAFPSGVAIAALQDLTPPELRGRITAIYYAVMNLFGLALGPLLVTRVMTVFSEGAGQLAAALALIAALVLPLAAALAWTALYNARPRSQLT